MTATRYVNIDYSLPMKSELYAHILRTQNTYDLLTASSPILEEDARSQIDKLVRAIRLDMSNLTCFGFDPILKVLDAQLDYPIVLFKVNKQNKETCMKKVNLRINGHPVQVAADNSYVLLDLVRETMGLTGTKQSCDRKGQCGACTVIVNGKAVLSCLTKVSGLNGAEVITVEGLGTPENPHLIQEAFVLAGAVQCGFCTPGMIMAAKALLDKNPNPSREEIKTALRRNLCRCTGYTKIIEAVELAGRFLRGETTPDAVRPAADTDALRTNHPRPSGLSKACGTAQFTADIRIPGALELVALRSPHPHARILSIDPSQALNMPGVTGVMTAKDIEGTNRLKFVVPDRPVLCEDRVRYIGDPVAVVAAETREQAVAALDKIIVE